MISIRSKADDVKARKVIKPILEYLNIQYTYTNYKELRFGYKGLEFVSNFRSDNDCLDLRVDFDTVNEDEWEDILFYINRMNDEASFAKMMYDVDEEDGHLTYNVSVRVGVRLTGELERDADMLCRMLDDCVSTTEEYSERSCVLGVYSRNLRRLERIVRRTMMENSGCVDTLKNDRFFSPDRTLTISHLLSLIDECWLCEDASSMKVVSDTMKEVKDPDKILLYNVFSPMGRKEWPRDESRWQQVTYIITNGPRSITITLTPQYEEGDVVYVMAGYFVCGNVREDSYTQPSTHGMMLAYDMRSDKIRTTQQECEEKDVSPGIVFEDDQAQTMIRYCLYWGCRYMNQKCYADAIIYLENIYKAVCRLQFEDRAEQIYLLAEMLGTCYNKLGLYNKAFYYNQFTFERGRWHDVPNYLTNLHALDDLRYDYMLEHHADLMKERIEDSEDDEMGGLQTERDFVFHNYTDRLIETQKYKKATKMLAFIRENCPDDKAYVKETEKRLKKIKEG